MSSSSSFVVSCCVEKWSLFSRRTLPSLPPGRHPRRSQIEHLFSLCCVVVVVLVVLAAFGFRLLVVVPVGGGGSHGPPSGGGGRVVVAAFARARGDLVVSFLKLFEFSNCQKEGRLLLKKNEILKPSRRRTETTTNTLKVLALRPPPRRDLGVPGLSKPTTPLGRRDGYEFFFVKTFKFFLYEKQEEEEEEEEEEKKRVFDETFQKSKFLFFLKEEEEEKAKFLNKRKRQFLQQQQQQQQQQQRQRKRT